MKAPGSRLGDLFVAELAGLMSSVLRFLLTVVVQRT
jgi:hypothetical protein